MKIKLNVQKDGQNLIKDKLLKESESKPKKAYFFMGNIKESGFDILEECLIDLKARKLIIIGIDKKNTTKKMLDTLIGYTKSVYVFNNNEEAEFDSNIVLFEYEKKAVIYIMNANVSEDSFANDIATYTEVEYNLEDKKDSDSYKGYVDELTQIAKLEKAIKLDKEKIKELFENKQIFTTKQYTYNVMTISELLGDSEKDPKNDKKVEKDDDIEVSDNENQKIDVPSIDLSDIEDFNIDIDIEDSIKREESVVEEVSKEKVKEPKDVKKPKKEKKVALEEVPTDNSEDLDFDPNGVLDIESLIFEKADIELDEKSIDKKVSKKKKESKEIAVSKKIDLTKVTNLIMELPTKPTKGKDLSVIKVPNYIKEMIPEFFAITAKGKSNQKEDGTYKESKIKLEIVDIALNKKYNDSKAELLSKMGQTYIMFESDSIKDIDYEEGDIIRIIKLAEDTYHMEIVAKKCQEYNIWKKLCNQSFKGSNRSYGVM